MALPASKTANEPAGTLPDRLPDRLLAWYDAHGRTLPWRTRGGGRPDPYHVWLSEIMLQQTTVATVGPYFRTFLDRWPAIADLSRAELDDVLHAWAGLGYYSRARNLHACARYVVEALEERFPETVDGLLALPGVGPYTAAAIAAIAFNRPATVVDGNVERVMARFYGLPTPLPALKKDVHVHAERLTPRARPGDYAQAVMDLGATVCTPKNPRCPDCPWADDCVSLATGQTTELPRRAPKKTKPTRRGIAFWLTRADGAVLLRKRPAKGLLGGMMEVPCSPWVADDASREDHLAHAPASADWQEMPGEVRHTFTHFHLELTMVRAVVTGQGADGPDGTWAAPHEFSNHALPTLMTKLIKHAQTGEQGLKPA